MKRRIFALIMILCIGLSVLPAYAAEAGEIISWHSSIQQGVFISWRMVNYSYISGNMEIAGYEFDVGDVFTFQVVDIPQTDANAVYDDTGPEFVELWLWNDTYVAWSDLSGDEFSVLFPRVVIPISYELTNGTTLNLEGAIHYIATFDAAIYAVTTTIVDANTIRAEYDTSYAYITIDYNANTGIARSFTIEAPYGIGYFELDIFQSSIDDNGTAIINTLTWHSSLVPGASISWMLDDLNTEENRLTLGEDEFGNEYNLYEGDDLTFAIVDDIPTDPMEVYGDEPPTFLEIYADDELVPFEAMDEGVGITFSWILNPIAFDFYNGTHFDFLELIELRLALNDLIIDYNYHVEGDYLILYCFFSWWQWDEGAQMDVQQNMTVTYTINTITGILYEAYFEEPESGNYGHFILDIWNSYMDDYGNVINNELTWFNKLTSGIWLTWEITTVEIIDPEMVFELAGHNLTVGDFIRFKLTSPIPTNPVEVYGDTPSDFVQLYINNDPVSWDDIEGVAGVFFQLLVLPLSLELYNGTTFDMVGIINLFGSMSDELTITNLNVGGDEVDFTMHAEQEVWYDGDPEPSTEIADFSYITRLATGIARQAKVSAPSPDYDPSTLVMVFNEQYSSIDVDGNDNTEFTESIPITTQTETTSETDTFSIPGYTIIVAFIGLVAMPLLLKRRK